MRLHSPVKMGKELMKMGNKDFLLADFNEAWPQISIISYIIRYTSSVLMLSVLYCVIIDLINISSKYTYLAGFATLDKWQAKQRASSSWMTLSIMFARQRNCAELMSLITSTIKVGRCSFNLKTDKSWLAVPLSTGGCIRWDNAPSKRGCAPWLALIPVYMWASR